MTNHFDTIKSWLPYIKEDQSREGIRAALDTIEVENKRLREALESARGALCGAISKVRENPNLAESTCWHGLHKIDVALKGKP